MSRRTASNPGASISLFPFLAVLICTMGSLVTLLFAFAKHGQEQATQAAKAKAAAEAQSGDVAVEREGLQWRIDQLRTARDKTQEQLADKRLELSHVEDHLRRLRDQADRLRIEAEELEKAGLARSSQFDDARSELMRLQRAIEERQRDLQDRKPREPQTVTYSVVPYTGPNQTRRRPIYIECRGDAVVLQSEGIVFRDTDFEPPLGPGNPLAAAVRAYNEYLNRLGFDGESTRPYPMLLVRPDGIVAYYAARSALESWGNEFGYELIGADWTLDFPPTDPTLAAGLENVVAEARVRQSALAAAAPRQYLKRSRGALRASPDGRGFVADSDDGEGSEYGGQGFAARYGGRGNQRGFGEGKGDREPGGGSAWSAAGRGGSGFGENASGGTYDGLGEHAGGGTGERSGSRPFAGSPESSSGSFGSGNAHGEDRHAGSNAGGRNSGNSGGELGPTHGSASGSAGAEGGVERGASRDRYAGQPGGMGKSELERFGSPGQGFQADAQARAGGAGSSRMGGQPGSASSSGGAGSAGSAGSAGGDSSQQEQSGTPSIAAQLPHRRQPESVASKRGRDWSLPDASQNSTPISRPVIVRCDSQQLTIVPDDNRALPRHIKLGQHTEDSVDELVSGVWDHMKGWGLAGRGMYWRPTLVLEVAPDAVARYSDLQALLADSGMEVQMRSVNAHKPGRSRR